MGSMSYLKLKHFLFLLVLLVSCALCSSHSETDDEARAPRRPPPPPRRPPPPPRSPPPPPRRPPPPPRSPPPPPRRPPPPPRSHPPPPRSPPPPPGSPPPPPRRPRCLPPPPPSPPPPTSPPPPPSSPPPPTSPPPPPSSPPPPTSPPTPPSSPPPPSRPEPGYDYFMLALTWPNGFCTEPSVTCRPSPPDQQNFFTVHGLWPQKNRGQALECQAEPVADNILAEWKDYLMMYWPRLYSAKNFEYSKQLWKMQWFRHGSCSSNKFLPEQYFECGLALGMDYGEKILEDLKVEGIKPDGSTEYSAANVLDAIKKSTGKKAIISCTKNKFNKLQLSEIRLCFSADAQTLENCIEAKPGCKEKFIFASKPSPSPPPPPRYPSPPPPPPPRYPATHASFTGMISSMEEVEEAVGI